MFRSKLLRRIRMNAGCPYLGRFSEAMAIRTWSQPVQEVRHLSAPTDQITQSVSHRGSQEKGRQGISFDLTGHILATGAV